MGQGLRVCPHKSNTLPLNPQLSPLSCHFEPSEASVRNLSPIGPGKISPRLRYRRNDNLAITYNLLGWADPRVCPSFKGIRPSIDECLVTSIYFNEFSIPGRCPGLIYPGPSGRVPSFLNTHPSLLYCHFEPSEASVRNLSPMGLGCPCRRQRSNL